MLDLYDSQIAMLDAAFQTLYEAWTPTRPDSVIVATSDHGEFFGEHGLIEHRGHVYPEVLHVPLVIAAPARLPAGVRIRTPVQLQDLYATLLQVAGIAELPGSLIPVIAGKPRPGPITASAWPGRDRAFLGGRHARTWHLFRLGAEALIFSESGERELYDVSRDPHLARDLSRERAARLEELRLAASVHFPEPWSTPELALSDEQRERLHALGYLGN